MKPIHFLLRTVVPVSLIALSLSSCEKEQFAMPENSSRSVSELSASPKSFKGTFFYGLTDNNEIAGLTSGNPMQDHGSVSISGLQPGENIMAIDYRPATRELYGVTNQSRLYVIDPANGNAKVISITPFSPAISGNMVGFDFNPTVDRIRLVTDQDQNLRLHPVTGVVAATDASLNPDDPRVVAVAYTNSFPGATTTTLYDINIADDMLYKQVPPNNGTLVAVGRLGLFGRGEGGFDISSDNSVALAAMYGKGDDKNQNGVSNGNQTRVYSINLSTGVAKNAGKTDRKIIGLAIPPTF